MYRTIAVVEDDESIREMLRYYFRSVGYEVVCFESGEAYFETGGELKPSLFILDIMLPGMDGLEILRRLQADADLGDVPVLMLTARTSEMDKVKGLEGGADDYVVKPFGVSELLARIRSTLRRADQMKISQGAQHDCYHVKDLTVDIAKHQVLMGDEEIHFTQNEFKILELLCIHAGKVLTYDFILEHVWGPYGGSGSNQILRVNMANIRRKLKENPSEPKYIHTELGIGYRMLED